MAGPGRRASPVRATSSVDPNAVYAGPRIGTGVLMLNEIFSALAVVLSAWSVNEARKSRRIAKQAMLGQIPRPAVSGLHGAGCLVALDAENGRRYGIVRITAKGGFPIHKTDPLTVTAAAEAIGKPATITFPDRLDYSPPVSGASVGGAKGRQLVVRVVALATPEVFADFDLEA